MTTSLASTPLVAAWREEITVFSDHLILVVTGGSVRVMVDEIAMELTCGDAVWVPPGFTVDLVETSPGGVAVPVFVPTHYLPQGPTAVSREKLTPDAVDKLLGMYSRQQFGDWEQSMREQYFADWSAPAGCCGSWAGFPQVPRMSAQRSIASGVLREMGFDVHAAGLAEEVDLAPRTIDRQFRQQVGIGFSCWRDRVRCSCALRLLSRGWKCDDVAQDVGFNGLSGMRAAFHRELGVAPQAVRSMSMERRGYLEGGDVFGGEMIAGFLSSLPSAPEASTYATVNDRHVLVWLRKGTASVQLSQETLHLKAGDLLWIPAGVWHRVRVDADSTLIPVGTRGWEAPMRRQNMVVFQDRDVSERTLLYCSMAFFTRLVPYLATQTDLDALLPPPPRSDLREDPILAFVRAQPVTNPASQEAMAAEFGTSVNEFMIRFERAIGQKYNAWRTDWRRTEARRLASNTLMSMRDLTKVMGYGRAPSFTRVFREGHNGEGPQAYRERFDHRWLASDERW